MRVSRSRPVSTVASSPGARARSAAKKKPVDRFFAPAPRPFELGAVLEAAGRIKRGPGPEGGEPVLSRAQRDRLTQLFAQLPPARSKALQQLLGRAPEGAAQALLLEAMAARADRLGSDHRALNVVQRFGKLLQQTPADELLERATVLDLDSSV